MTAPTTTAPVTNEYWVDGADIADTKAPRGVDIDQVGKTRPFQARLVNPATRPPLNAHHARHGRTGRASPSQCHRPRR